MLTSPETGTPQVHISAQCSQICRFDFLQSGDQLFKHLFLNSLHSRVSITQRKLYSVAVAVTALGHISYMSIASVRIFLDLLSLLNRDIVVKFESLFQHKLICRLKFLLRTHFTANLAEHGFDLVGRVGEWVGDGDLRLINCVFDACGPYFSRANRFFRVISPQTGLVIRSVVHETFCCVDWTLFGLDQDPFMLLNGGTRFFAFFLDIDLILLFYGAFDTHLSIKEAVSRRELIFALVRHPKASVPRNNSLHFTAGDFFNITVSFDGNARISLLLSYMRVQTLA